MFDGHKEAPLTRRHGASFRHPARGFTLMEVLVSIVVLSFGMLGMVGIQAFALQSNREARMQAQAVNLARELAEMMRGNNQVGIKTTAADNPYLIAGTSPLSPATASNCLGVGNSATGCSTTLDVAHAEMTDWLARVDTELPGARVTVCFDSAPYDTNGLPQWTCTPGTTGTDEIAVIKIGWTRQSTDRSKKDASMLERASDANSRPSVLVPVTSGNPLGAPS
ncbi:MAG: type IV pilus modification protein PilV [Acidovorax sp.]|uniref:type IV pilus modification protein PilV n=1 Tax=Acidovorax sp. TaxID=1872122 RepID=UPI0039E25665